MSWIGVRSSQTARTFYWMTRWRRLVRAYEKRIDVSTATIRVAVGSLL